MSIEANKQLVNRFLAAMASGDADVAFALVADDATWWIPTDQPGGMVQSKAAMRPLVAGFLAVFQRQPVFEVQSMVAEGDRVAVLHSSRGGLTHGGATYGNDYHMLFRLRDGAIVEIREYMNPLLAGGVVAELQAAR